MTVAARAASTDAEPANPNPTPRPVDFGGADGLRAGTYPFASDALVADWHTHDLHQLQYAAEGVVEVDTGDAHYLLPPRQAVWIPAGVPHRTTLRRAQTVSVFFAPGLIPGGGPGRGERARVTGHRAAWRIISRTTGAAGNTRATSDSDSDEAADAFFRALALVVAELFDQEAPLCLPTSRDPAVAAAMRYTDEHLSEVTAADVGRAVGWSERTLRRRFAAATGMTWREYLVQGRLIRAMALLSDPGPTVLDVATAVGFDSASAFARSYRAAFGETPSAYRRRINAAE